MTDYPATTLALNKGKYYVLLTIPAELREYFNGRKQLKRSTGTSDLRDAKRRQHDITVELYAQLDTCKPDIRDTISDLLGWIGDADEVQRMEDTGKLHGFIQYCKNLEYGENPDDDADVDHVNENGAKALELYKEWLNNKTQDSNKSGAVHISVASSEYLLTKPYGPAKTTRDCELSLEQFQEFAGDVLLTDVTAVLIHEYAEYVGTTKSRETVSKKIGYVKRMFDHGVRKGWISSNVFTGLVISKNIGRARQSYIPLSNEELINLFDQDMPIHLRSLLSILVTTGMRLDEAALLNWEDVKEDKEQDVIYFDLTNSIVKTQGSQRKVPVHSVLTWVKLGRVGQVFPQFSRDADGKAQASASKALMPLIRNVTDEKAKVIHSLRGNFKDALRDLGVAKETNDFITGHASGDVAGGYGNGPSLKVRKEAMERVSFAKLNLE